MNIFTGLHGPKILFETESQYNGHIKVIELNNGTRKIRVDNIDQSISHFAPNCSRLYWGKVVDILKENKPDLSNMFILGLGGGTLVHLIHNNFPNVHITSVDIDQVMVDIAKNYFDLDSVPNHRVIVADAMRVVIEPDEFEIPEYSYDGLLVDIYIGEKFPDLGKSGNFIAALKRLIKPGGIIIFNRIYREEHQDDVNIFIDYVSEFFPSVKNLVVAGYTNSDNVLIYAIVNHE
ncbi:methyltransferase domain-containing protein [candidate division WWE3 bacterium]|jgi:spermidine synthase|uniref:Methyltransferase domain-containing protein n=1 Tax=candidate division WWE3 bacterium TaxID=2053526 RepID=A0A3A4ZE31_UNCKA|nr:MAG: methyltransferase domain-containing protein [candidate division WWE3 bacterium]